MLRDVPTIAAAPVEQIFSALGDPVRFTIVEHLTCRDHATVSDLASLFTISLQAVSKHIKVLEAAGVVTQGRDGRHRPVSLRPAGIAVAYDWLEARRQQLEARYSRLDQVLTNLTDLDEGTPR